MRRDLIMFFCGALVGALLVGSAFSQSKPASHHTQSKPTNRYKKLDIFATVLSYIESNYVDPVDGKELIYGAIKGMLSTLDPYSSFMPPQIYKEMKAETSGEYGGPGLEISRKGRQIVVITPIPGSPAARAGIQSGDLLLRINKQNMKSWSVMQAMRALRGRPGTKLTLWLQRKGWRRPRRVVLVREQIKVQSVTSKVLQKGYGYIRIKSFQDRTPRQLTSALQKLKRHFGLLRGVVLDLRNNPGGLFDQSVRVADLFLSRGVIVTTRGRHPANTETERAHPKGTFEGFPLVLLINQGSASASEILAGALQDYGRALLMGSRSFGKGSVQTVLDLSDGSGLKLTIARYYTPLGRMIQKKGIHPDVRVRHSGNWGHPSRDLQLRTALRYLKDRNLYKRHLRRGLPTKR